MTPVVAVLGYHKIGDPPAGSWETWYLVPERTFSTHLELLARDGWELIDLPRFVRGLDDPSSLPRRSALLTFDDGYKSMAVAGRRALGGRPGVFFVPSDHIGRMNTFEGDGPEPPEMLCDDDDLRLLEQSGLAIESHGASHGTFPDMTAEELRNEAWRSKVELERVVGRTVTTLAYPYGYPGQDPESTAAILAAAGYRCAFVYGGGLVRFPITHRFLLPRLAIGPDTDLPALIQPELEASSWRA